MSWTHRSFWQPLLVGLLVVGILGWPTRGQARKRPKPKASSSALQTVDLGTRPIHDTGGESGELTVEIPEGAVSAIVHCGGFGDTALGSVWHLVDPTGKVVWDGELRQNEGFRSDFVDDWAVAVLPQSPRAPLIPGTYTVAFWVGADNLGSARCGAIIRSHPVTPEPTFKLEFVFVGLEGMTAATAPENKGFQKFIAAFEEDLSRGKVAVDYTLKDFEGDVPRFTVVDVADDDMAEFNALLTHAHPQEPTAITVFLVQEIANSTAGGATILGMSAGPPGLRPSRGPRSRGSS